MITYFADHEETASRFVQQGAVIPIHHIQMYDYTVFCGVGSPAEALQEWSLVKTFGVFNLSIGEDRCFWVSQLNELQEWSPRKLQGSDPLTEQVYRGTSGILTTRYRAVRMPLASGYYTVTISGLRRNASVSGESAETPSHGFLLELQPVERLEAATDPTTVDFSFS